MNTKQSMIDFLIKINPENVSLKESIDYESKESGVLNLNNGSVPGHELFFHMAYLKARKTMLSDFSINFIKELKTENYRVELQDSYSQSTIRFGYVKDGKYFNFEDVVIDIEALIKEPNELFSNNRKFIINNRPFNIKSISKYANRNIFSLELSFFLGLDYFRCEFFVQKQGSLLSNLRSEFLIFNGIKNNFYIPLYIKNNQLCLTENDNIKFNEDVFNLISNTNKDFNFKYIKDFYEKEFPKNHLYYFIECNVENNQIFYKVVADFSRQPLYFTLKLLKNLEKFKDTTFLDSQYEYASMKLEKIGVIDFDKESDIEEVLMLIQCQNY